MKHSIVVLLLMSLIVAACGEGAEEGAATTAATTSTTESATTTTSEVITTSPPTAAATTTQTPVAGRGCAALHDPGEYEGLGTFEDKQQPYWMVVPKSYAEIAPAPLYVYLAAGDGDHHGFLAGMLPYLDDLDGLMAVVNTTGGRSPNELASLLGQLTDQYCVQPDRVHVMGSSSSLIATERFVCEHADKIASFMGGGGWGAGVQCTPERPVPLMAFTGDPDRSGIQALVERWARINGCEPEPVTDDLGSGVLRKTYQSCAGHILFFDIEGMGHSWPMHEVKGPGAAWIEQYDEIDYLEEALRFFAEHPLE